MGLPQASPTSPSGSPDSGFNLFNRDGVGIVERSTRRGAWVGALTAIGWFLYMYLLARAGDLTTRFGSTSSDSEELTAFAKNVLIAAGITGLVLGLLVGSLMGASFKNAGRRAALASGLILPITLAALTLFWGLYLEPWANSAWQYVYYLVLVLIVPTIGLFLVVKQHVGALEAHSAKLAAIAQSQLPPPPTAASATS